MFSKHLIIDIIRIKKYILEEVLKNSPNILHTCNTKVTNEVSIYKQVLWFLRIIFPTTRRLNKARFINQFKTYHPDILIPEIKSAVEFKYILMDEKIDNYLDQVKTDADNYIGDFDYDSFYAVLYFATKSSPKKSILSSWREKKFPENWKLIIVEH